MSTKIPLILPTPEQLKNICAELGETDDKLKNRVDLFKQWLKIETHLSSEADEALIKNFIRLSKFDLQRAKKKYEMYMLARGKYRDLFMIEKPTNDIFSWHIQRFTIPLKTLTPEGYRIVVMRGVPESEDLFQHTIHNKYTFLTVENLLLNDCNSALVGIVDVKGISAKLLTKMNMTLAKQGNEIVFNVFPHRFHQIHVVNMNSLAHAVLSITMSVMSEKVKKRVLMHKHVSDMHNFIDAALLPEEYGGTLPSLDVMGDAWRDWYLQETDLYKRLDKLQLVGPMPKEKQQGFSFDDFQMDGSFRQLQID